MLTDAQREWMGRMQVLTLTDRCEVVRDVVLGKDQDGDDILYPQVVARSRCLYNSGRRVEMRDGIRTVVQDRASFKVEPGTDVQEKDRIRHKDSEYPVAGVTQPGTLEFLLTVDIEETK